MLCVSIAPRSSDELLSDFEMAKSLGDCVEVRFDQVRFDQVRFDQACFDRLPVMNREVPCMLTLREKEPLEKAFVLARAQPTYLALPHDLPKSLFIDLRAEFPKVKLIVSYHHYEKTPENIEETLLSLRGHPCCMIKMVTKAESALDGLRMLVLLQKYGKELPLAAFCMGEKASFTRSLAPLYGGKMTFCSLVGKPTAEGQLSAKELLHTYRYRSLSPATELYALVGNPIAHSQSHITHNALFQKLQKDAVYVKIPLTENEFGEGFEYLRTLGIRGLSVTRPLKNFFGKPYNTVRCSKDDVRLLNTDGLGMLDAIEQFGKVSRKKITILGAGPTAEAIAQESIARGATVVITNRTQGRAIECARRLGCEAFSWDLDALLAMPYDVLVNATSVGMPGEPQFLPVKAEHFKRGAVVADVISGGNTPFLRMAENCGCKIVSGQKMWLNQAARQFQFWDETISPVEALDYMDGILTYGK